MTPSLILKIYIALFLIELCFSLLLDRLNLAHIRANSGKVPDFLEGAVPPGTYKKSVEYSITKLRFSMVTSIISGVVLLAVVISGGFGWIDNWVMSFGIGVYGEGILYFLTVSLFFYVVGIPFSLFSTFVIEERFGFNKTTFRLWLVDQVKALIISAIFLSLLVSGLFWFMSVTGRNWWIYGFLFVAAIQLFMVYAYPIWIAPLFNKFTALQDKELSERIGEVANKAGYMAESIFVMDGSKRSAHANAYFTGFGKAKRIVLYDTLLSTLNHEQILSVLAHEIGHEKLNHIKKSMILSLSMLLIGLYVVNLILTYEPLFFAFGFNRVSYHGALVLFSFASAPVTFWLSPLFSMLSRVHEYEADAFALRIMKSMEGLKSGLVELSKKSLSNFTPHPLYSFFHYSHPTLYERVKAMESVDVG